MGKKGEREPQLKAKNCDNTFPPLNKATAPVTGRRLTLNESHGR